MTKNKTGSTKIGEAGFPICVEEMESKQATK